MGKFDYQYFFPIFIFFKVSPKNNGVYNFFPNKHSLSTPLSEYSLSLLGCSALLVPALWPLKV